MNRFHWHLTDDQGWRIEIRRYPGLAATSAWRVDHEDVQWNARPAQKPGEAATYGGYYTQQEIREIVRYAADRFITVVPEIEMPAHVSAVLAAYPGLSCTGGPFTAPPGGIWPLKDILCAGNDSVFTFLQNVLTEVADLFPGPYIHIGGDEADKTEWRRCPKCQGRIAAEHLANEEELQSYFVHRVERILAGLGKKLIGWDEILEGGLAPDATVMSWRGTQGGIAAARQRHDVIMSPTSHCYFDYYQGDRSLEPIAIGGFIPLSTVYAFEPTPDSLTAEETGHILGVQANLWTEYIPTPEKAQYMIFPRIAAIAEVGWTARARRDWSDFLTRLPTYYERLDAHGTPAARSVYAVLVEDSLDAAAWKRIVRLTTECGMPGVRYTLDGSEPGPSSPVYGGPVVLDRTATIRAALFLNGRRAGPITNRTVYLGRKGIAGITLRTPFDPAKGGATGPDLLDGVRGPEWPYDRRWGGIEGSDFEAVIDLGGRVPVHAVTAGFLHEPVNMIFPPPRVEVALSDDGTTFATVDTVFGDTFQKEHRFFVRDYRASAGNAQARYVRVRAANPGPGPAWHKESGKPTWLYIDEIIVE
jgi:hexosaminidase